MAGDAPLLERLAKLPAVPAAAAVELLERLHGRKPIRSSGRSSASTRTGTWA